MERGRGVGIGCQGLKIRIKGQEERQKAKNLRKEEIGTRKMKII